MKKLGKKGKVQAPEENLSIKRRKSLVFMNHILGK